MCCMLKPKNPRRPYANMHGPGPKTSRPYMHPIVLHSNNGSCGAVVFHSLIHKANNEIMRLNESLQDSRLKLLNCEDVSHSG
jgi:hypothetical protein